MRNPRFDEWSEKAKLRQVRAWYQKVVKAHPGEFVTCPTCGRGCRTYEHRLTPSKAKALILLDREYEPLTPFNLAAALWLIYKRFDRRPPTRVADLQYFGLLEPWVREDNGYEPRGWYMVTELAHEWVECHETVPEAVVFRDRQFLYSSGEQVTIDDVLHGEDFDFEGDLGLTPRVRQYAGRRGA